MRTTRVDKESCQNYLKKADQCIKTAKEALDKGRWNASAINSVHAVISSCDALTVFYLGLRSSGERHEDVIDLMAKTNIREEEFSKVKRQVLRVLTKKNLVEYEERLVYQKEAESIFKDAERVYSWVRNKIGS
jgi:HEPN domain-containing protein